MRPAEEGPGGAHRSRARSCPLCGEPNDCALARDGEVTECWCVAEQFPPELLASVADADRDRCICRACRARAVAEG